MIVGVDVALLHLVVACLGNLRLNGYDGLRLLLRRGLVGPGQREQLFQVLLVSLQHALVLCVIGEIIVALAKSESALPHGHKVPLRVFLVGPRANAEHHRRLTVAVELRAHQLVFLAVFYCRYLVERRLDGSPSLTVQANGVHQEVVKRAYLLPQRALLLRF